MQQWYSMNLQVLSSDCARTFHNVSYDLKWQLAQDLKKTASPFASEAQKVEAKSPPGPTAIEQDQWYYLDPAGKIQVGKHRRRTKQCMIFCNALDPDYPANTAFKIWRHAICRLRRSSSNTTSRSLSSSIVKNHRRAQKDLRGTHKFFKGLLKVS